MLIDPDEMVFLGQINATFGIKGWVKVYSHTETRAGIVDYHPWYLKHRGQWQRVNVTDGRAQGKGVVARIEGVDDCNSAQGYIGAEIYIRRDQLSDAGDDGYYWIDLEGLQVRNRQAEVLGKVDYLFNCGGANDVLVVKGDRERLIPYIKGQVIVDVDLDRRVLTVDWDSDF